MSKRVEFSANARVYDRRHGAVISDDVVHRLTMAAGLEPGMRILDIGAGTGRVALPLADFGCEVIALEPATGMVQALRNKSGGRRVRPLAGDGYELPFASGRFEAVVIARLLYLTADWRRVLREAHRVLIDGGRLLHEWGNGDSEDEWVQIREKARTLFEQAGVEAPFHPGVRSEREVNDWITNLGFIQAGDLSFGAGATLTLAEFLQRLATGEFSYTWNVPKAVLEECLPSLRQWSVRTFDLEKRVAVPRELRWTVYRK